MQKITTAQAQRLPRTERVTQPIPRETIQQVADAWLAEQAAREHGANPGTEGDR